MEGDAQQKQSGEQRPLKEEDPTASHNLTSLLEDESFLLMVFEHLVEHGLQNCRLVCRRWYEVCKHFPVELEDVDTENLRMLDAFPNAASLSLECSRGKPVLELFERLSTLKGLKSFAFVAASISFDDSARPYFQSMSQLTDLGIFNGLSGLPDNLIASVKHLTNLTRLHIHTGPPRRQLDPFVELKKIRDLNVNTFTLFNKNGVIMFPSLTNLTRLIFEGSQLGEEHLLNPLEVKRFLLSAF